MKKWKWLGLIAAFAMVLAACGGDTASTTTAGPGTTAPGGATTTTAPGATAGEGGNLLLLQWQGASQANPYLSTGTKDLLAGSLVLEALAQWSPGGELVPQLAEEIPTLDNGGIADDLTSITWTLKEGVLWSDGTPLTSADVVFSYEYCSAEASGCIQSGVFDSVVSVVADDDLTATITFDGPTPFPYTPFVGFTMPIIQAAQFADCVGTAAVACTDQNFAPIGTGPYMVTELRPEDTVTYAFNPNYRGVSEGKPYFGTVEIKGGGDAESAARSVLEIGEADYAWNLQVAPEVLAQIESGGQGVILSGFTSNVEHLNFNQTNPRSTTVPRSDYADGTNPHPVFYDNPDFVRALSIAIDRAELVAVGYGAAGTPTCNIWPAAPALSTNNDECLTQDIAGANAILDGLGYLDTNDDGIREHPVFGELVFDSITSTNAVRQLNQDLIQDYWQQIGIGTNMKNADAGLFFDGTAASDDSIWKFFNDIQMYTNGATGPDPQAYMAGFLSNAIAESTNNYGGDNLVRYADPAYDALWAELTRTADLDRRNEITIQLNDMVIQSGAVVALVYRGSVSAFANSIQGVGELNAWDSEYWNIQDWYRDDM